jgi:hypothetical protein
MEPQYFKDNGFDWPANGALDVRLKGNSDPVGQSPRIHPKPSLGQMSQFDGSSNTILYGENSDLNQWNEPYYEMDACLVWEDSETPSQVLNKLPPGVPSLSAPDTIGSVYANNPSVAILYARPSSQHPTGFHLFFCDAHTKFTSETLDYRVYMQTDL